MKSAEGIRVVLHWRSAPGQTESLDIVCPSADSIVTQHCWCHQHLWGFAEGLSKHGCSSHGDAVLVSILNGRVVLSMSFPCIEKRHKGW